jgi:GntR family transcriptional repressor for pyruvate dehydrogenase complex
MQPIEKPNLSEEIINRVLKQIITKEMEPGDKLPTEREIASLLGVGRSSVREALNALKILGILEVRPGGGTYYKNDGLVLIENSIKWGLLLNKEWEKDLMQFRYVIEPQFAYVACQNRTDDDLSDMEEILDRYYGSSSFEEAALEDMRFHTKIGEATKNIIFSSIIDTIQELLQTYIKKSIIKLNKDIKGVVENNEHKLILAAIRDRQGEKALGLMIQHLQKNNRIWGYNFDDKLKLL